MLKKRLSGQPRISDCLSQILSRRGRHDSRNPFCGRLRRQWRVFAARSRGNQKRDCQQDRNRQRRGHEYHRCFHRSPIAVHITAPCRSRMANGFGKNDLGGNRHRHADLDREHREGDDQAKRQRTNRQRSGDGVVQSGGGDGRRAAFKTRRAGRPYHGRVPLDAQANHLRLPRSLQSRQAILRRLSPRKWRNRGEISGYARYSTRFRPRRPSRRRPRHPAASPWRRNHRSARSAAARHGRRGKSPDRNRSDRRHGCSRRARCRRP
jgi:hypothetical protein